MFFAPVIGETKGVLLSVGVANKRERPELYHQIFIVHRVLILLTLLVTAFLAYLVVKLSNSEKKSRKWAKINKFTSIFSEFGRKLIFQYTDTPVKPLSVSIIHLSYGIATIFLVCSILNTIGSKMVIT